jgi:small subunit ribosomal protein S6
MPLYENVFIARQDISGAQAEALADGFVQLIAEQGGEVKKREYWGLRNLAYRMNKNRKGHYVLFNIEAPAPAIAELERTMRINEDVIRYLTLRVDALEEAPSAVMQSRGSREDRPRRSDRDRYGEGRERFGEPREVKQHVRSRMTATDDKHAVARIAVTVAPENIGHAIGDAIRERNLTDRRSAGSGRGIRIPPRPGRVNDGAR